MKGKPALKRTLTLLCSAIAPVLAGCGTQTHPAKSPRPASCNLPVGSGHMGACAPSSFTKGAQKFPTQAQGGLTFSDRSNNDPTTNLTAIRRAGHPAIYLKAIEGTGFTDRTFAPSAAAAKRAGVAPGGYDFVRTYSAREAYLFVARLRAAGTCGAKNTLPPALDIEAGVATRSGVANMVQILRRSCGRVALYTGLWYWNPYLGQFWPGASTAAWISGYPNIIGRTGYRAVAIHQFTDRGCDGASCGVDLNRWQGTAASLRAFINATPAKPERHPRPPQKAKHHRKPLPAALHALYHQRAVVARLQRRHHCSRRPRSRAACAHWKLEQHQLNHKIRRHR